MNHGTDHTVGGELVGDTPLYARIGYSTVTTPLLDSAAWSQPLDQSAALVHPEYGTTHRAGFELIDVRVQDNADGRVRIAGSVARAHWIVPDPQQLRQGSGIAGAVRIAGRLTVFSFVREVWELRLVRFEAPEGEVDPTELTIRLGGWAVAGEAPATTVDGSGAAASAGSLCSRICAVRGTATARIAVRNDASPLGPVSAVPFLDYPVLNDEWTAALIELADDSQASSVTELTLRDDGDDIVVTITWPDSETTISRVSAPPVAPERRGVSRSS